MAQSEQRQKEILRLTFESGLEVPSNQTIRGEIADFLKTCTDKDELDFFAANWHRECHEKPLHELIENPHVDAGTLLRVFWYSDPEFYYDGNRSASELEEGLERDVFTTLEGIERRITTSDYKTASIPFDPKNWYTMRDQNSEFARPIPEVMYQPITG